MGTGTFLSVNTGTKPHASIAGLYPVVGWKIGDEIVMVAEGQSSDTSTVIDWCQAIDLFKEYTDIDEVVTSIKSSDDVYFVPAFSGIQVLLKFVLFKKIL
jgi:putative glycerol kinase 5